MHMRIIWSAIICFSFVITISVSATTSFMNKATSEAFARVLKQGSGQSGRRKLINFDEKHGIRCLASLLLDRSQDVYIQGAEMLAKSALFHATAYFDEHVMLLLEGREYREDVLDRAVRAGWRLLRVPAITPPHPSTYDRFRDQFAKLHLLNLARCDEVVYMDTDAVFVDTMSTPFTPIDNRPVSSCRLWAARDFRAGSFVDSFNMGVAVLRPNQTELTRLLDLLHSDAVPYEHAMFEQGFFNAVYKDEWCELDFKKNANLAVYWAAEHGTSQQAMWHSTKLEVIHFTMSKPWACDAVYREVCDLWLAQNRTNVHPVTVVSAYYAGPAKHSNADYARWGANFLRMRVPIVLFTDDTASVPGLENRSKDSIQVIKKDPADFRVSHMGFDWDAQLALDPERGIHSEHLYRVWLEKSSFVDHAMHANPFRSTHFVWVDYGCFRDEQLQPWEPTTANLAPSKMLVLNISSLDPYAGKRIGGTIFGGDRQAWGAWARHFYGMLRSRYAAGEFVGDDQTTMTRVADKHENSVHEVQPRSGFGDAWFYLQRVLEGLPPCRECT